MMRQILVAFALVCLSVPGARSASSARSLLPFTAHYAVYLDGQQRGESTIRLERVDSDRWRYLVNVEGTSGLARLAGFEADDRSEFIIDADGQLRLQRMESHSKALFKSREVRAELDWQRRLANWSGDLKDDRRAPTALTGRAVSGPLLNLALALDAGTARNGQSFVYQMLDRGSSKQVDYIAQPIATIEVPAGRFEARPLRRDRSDRNRVVTAWYSPDLPPTPVRMLQTDDGKPSFELRLLRVD